MSVKITDCTIRDGGYLFNKNPSPDFVKGIMRGLAEAGIDFVETGFLQSQLTSDSLVYSNSIDARRFLPKNQNGTMFLGFCDNSRYSPDLLDACDGRSFKWLRISFAKHEIEEALVFCEKAQKLGYKVQFNPMDSIGYSIEEREQLIEKVNLIKPASLSIVDTFGAMHIEDLITIFKQMDALLIKGIAIGLHSHDNLGLSTALAETLILLASKTDRDVIVDGSLNGMGRGAGNASTELLANYINKSFDGTYDVNILLDTIHEFIEPVRDKVHWGYDLPMFVCGATHSHVDNVYHLEQDENVTPKDMYKILNSMSASQRTRYGVGYSKNDFSFLDEALNQYNGREK